MGTAVEKRLGLGHGGVQLVLLDQGGDGLWLGLVWGGVPLVIPVQGGRDGVIGVLLGWNEGTAVLGQGSGDGGSLGLLNREAAIMLRSELLRAVMLRAELLRALARVCRVNISIM